ncbi:MAG: septum formation initiator family protein [Candidatus Adiutrix sp.]|jgi:cell division protein FtsB|nr:septum formation initiator family protein [Candidatus Adiutrix sp.]
MNESTERRLESDQEAPPSRLGSLIAFILAAPRFLGSRLGLIALGLVILASLIYLTATADVFPKRGALEQEIKKLEHDIAVLEDDNRILRQKLERLQTDPNYVEDEARKKLGLVRPGETVYRLSEEPDLTAPPREPPAPPPPPPVIP